MVGPIIIVALFVALAGYAITITPRR